MSEIMELAAKLKSEGERLAELFGRLTESDWDTEVYTEGTVWRVRNVLAHLIAAERSFLKQLFPNVRAGGGGVSEDFSIDRHNARQQEKAKDLDPSELLKQYKSIRSEMIRWVLALDVTDLEKSGRHPFLGPTTLREMIKMVYIHNQMHCRDIKRALK